MLEDVEAYCSAPRLLEPDSEAMLAVRPTPRALLERIEFNPKADTLGKEEFFLKRLTGNYKTKRSQ